MNHIFVWTIGDAIATTITILCLAAWLGISAYQGARQFLCRHDKRISETSSCDAICSKCGKNLGFIGAWHEKQKLIAKE